MEEDYEFLDSYIGEEVEHISGKVGTITDWCVHNEQVVFKITFDCYESVLSAPSEFWETAQCCKK